HIWRLLDEKIKMFEMVVGQLDTILTQLHLDKSFESHLIDIFIHSESEGELVKELDQLADGILKARKEITQSRLLDLLP
ncbi:MAG: ATP-dependent helicase, partial [Firmicutes bacterium]|nr:ATP-dependent helicase [Bacillota bacterium]